MRRDVDRAQMPGGSAWNLVDFIPDELGAPLTGRGGWTYSGSSMTGPTSFKSMSYAPFSAGAQIVGVSQEPAVWNVVAAAGATGTPHTAPGGPPAFHRNKLIIPNNDGTSNVSYFDGASVLDLAGSPPAGQLVSVYKDHTMLAKSSANKNRIWFSAAGDPTTWDTSSGYWDTTGDIAAIGTLLNAVLIFHNDSTERLRGTTPPPGTDMVLEPFLDYGCIDPFSVVSWRNRLVFASAGGIYMTDGATDLDLTASAQMKTYWQSLLSGYTTSWRVAGGVYRDHYIVSINNGTTLVDCLCVDLLRRTMWRFTNLHGNAFAHVTGAAQEELYMGSANAGRAMKLSTLWSPSSTVKQDGDGTNPAPVMETAMQRGWDRLHRRWIQSLGKQKWRFAYLDYDLRDSASDNPTITMSYATTPTGSYTACSPTFAETTDYSRGRRSLSSVVGGGQRTNMVAFKLAVAGPYAAAKIYALEGTFESIEIGQL